MSYLHLQSCYTTHKASSRVQGHVLQQEIPDEVINDLWALLHLIQQDVEATERAANYLLDTGSLG